MCLTEEAEMALYRQMDDCADWGAVHVHLPVTHTTEDLPAHPQIDAELRTSTWSDEVKAAVMFVAPAVASLVAFVLLVWGWKP
jgi:hypothetical protein